jgi:hypothetical protein
VRASLSDTPLKGALRERNVNLGVAARRGRIYSEFNHFSVTTQSSDCWLPITTNAIFGLLGFAGNACFCQSSAKPRNLLLCSCYELAIGKSVPFAFSCFNNDVVFEGISKRGRRAVIEEYQHRPLGRVAEQEARQGSVLRIR